MLITIAGPVIDLAEVPWTPLGIAAGIFWLVLEARLVKAGFVRQRALDNLTARVDACVLIKDVNGLSERIGERFATCDRDRDAIKSLVLMARTDLDGTRDRVTHLEGRQEAIVDRLVESVKPLGRIEEKLDTALSEIARHGAEIDNLKRKAI